MSMLVEVERGCMLKTKKGMKKKKKKEKETGKNLKQKYYTLRMCAIHQIIKCFSVWREEKLRDEKIDETDLRQGRVTKEHLEGI